MTKLLSLVALSFIINLTAVASPSIHAIGPLLETMTGLNNERMSHAKARLTGETSAKNGLGTKVLQYTVDLYESPDSPYGSITYLVVLDVGFNIESIHTIETHSK